MAILEEFRTFLADRLAFSLINLNQLRAKGFKEMESGAVLMDDETRKIVLAPIKNVKQDEILHPFLEEKVTIMPSGVLQPLSGCGRYTSKMVSEPL